MKYLSKLLTLLVFLSLVIFISCGGNNGGGDDPEPPVGQAVAEQLAAVTWTPESGGVTLDGDARTEWSEAGFTLSFDANSDFTGGTYSVQNVPDFEDADLVWNPSGGQWAFDTNGDGEVITDKIIRDGDESVVLSVSVSVDDIENPTSGTLTLTFTIPEPTNRIDGFTGPWSFRFTVQ